MAPDYTRYGFLNINSGINADFNDIWDTKINESINYLARRECYKNIKRRDDVMDNILVTYGCEVIGKAKEIIENYEYKYNKNMKEVKFIDLNQVSSIENLIIAGEIQNKRLFSIDFIDCELSNFSFDNCVLENINFVNCINIPDLDRLLLDDVKSNDDKVNRQGEIVQKRRKVYKKAYDIESLRETDIFPGTKIVTLELIPGSIVFCINGSKCRTNKAKVIAIDGDTTKGLKAISSHDKNFIYEVGKIVEVEDFDCRYNEECSSGIHFFNTKEEAERYWI